MEDEKKKKLDYRILSRVKCVCGCGRFLKQNVIDRNPRAKNCYYSYLVSKGKTHVFTGSIEIKGIETRKKIYSPIKPMLDRLKRTDANAKKQGR